MDVVQSGSNSIGVSVLLEGGQELEVALAVLDGDDVRVQGLDGREDVVEVRVAHVGVDLGFVLQVGSTNGDLERAGGPLQILLPVRLTQGQTLTDSGLIHLDDLDAGLFKIQNLLTDGDGQLHGGLATGDIVAHEGPLKHGDRSSEHTLHGTTGKGLGKRSPLDSHGSRTRNVAVDDGRLHTAGSVGLDPSVLRKDVSLELLAEVLDHVVTLELAMHQNGDVQLLLEANGALDLLPEELVVLALVDLTRLEVAAGHTHLGGLGEGSNGGGGEGGELQLGLLSFPTSVVDGTTVDVALAKELDLGLDGGVVDERRDLARGGGGGVAGQGIGKGLGLGFVAVLEGIDCLGNGTYFTQLLDGKGKPVLDFLAHLDLSLKGVRRVEKGARGGHKYGEAGRRTISSSSSSLKTGLHNLNGLIQIGLPNVAAVDHAEGNRRLLGSYGNVDSGLQFLGRANEIHVECVNGKFLNNGEVVAKAAEVVGHQDLGAGHFTNRGIGLVVQGGVLVRQVEGQYGLVDLDPLRAGGDELLDQIHVERQQTVEEGNNGLEISRLGLADVEEGDWTHKNGSGFDAQGLGLQKLADGLRRSGGEFEGLLSRELGHHVVVVGVEPLLHLEGR
mmetsp:Transcript_18854/g.34198  ORF Transcript_18854/g.34198 Transcript_18854/m.34198 type:complete len:615 (-) Transcript_18854:549-2393(-)